jgi:gas vesicle protein GvpL/GvpF
MATGLKAKARAKTQAKVPAKAAPRAQSRAQIIHLYGVTQAPGLSRELFRHLKGIDGVAALEPLECGGLICWISRVPEADFARDLAENMHDLEWLAAVSTRHQEAISAIARAADILPARFGLEFSNDLSLRSHIETRRAALKADFQRLQGKQEWGVKVFALPAAPLAKKKFRTGKEYLQAKSALSRPVSGTPDPALSEFAEAVKSISDQIAEGGKFAAARRDLEFHKVLLLKRSDQAKLEALIRKYSRKWKGHKRVECTGPWPPFSFVSQTESSTQ